MPYAKNKITVNVPHRSGFDKSHRNSGTLTCGTLTPILCDELIPGSRVSLKLNLATQLPPLASDTYMNLKLKAEAFFCPSRLLCQSFEDWFCDNGPIEVADSSVTSGRSTLTPRIPYFTPSDCSKLGPGSLADYLGIKVPTTADPFSFNALPFLAYHFIWQEWYRNPRVQRPAFLKRLNNPQGITAASPLVSAPYVYFSSPSASTSVETNADLGTCYQLADAFDVFSMRQRNFGLDYFTGSRLSAQQGIAVSLNVPISPNDLVEVIDTSSNTRNVLGDDTTSGFTIAALRAANSLQQFRERNNLPSPRLVDQVKARYGAILSDGVAQRPICIGTASYEVDSMGISQTGDVTNPASQPFDAVGAQYGRAFAAGSDFIISDFTANEPGYLMVLISLVPDVTYATGVDRMFIRYIAAGSITEMANPLLQNVGDQPIHQIELNADTSSVGFHVVGYQDRFGDFMYKPNSAHGLFRDGQSLSSYVLQRSFAGSSPISQSSSLLQIPKNYLDQVMAVSSAVSGVSAWYDCKLSYRVSMPLAEFSIPSLQDPAYEHGKPVILHRNGQIF